jgi:Mg2+ and Co2+ transporter CorA
MSKLIIQSIRAHLEENQKLLNDLLKAQSELEANYDFFGLPEEDKKKAMADVTLRVNNVSEIVKTLENKLNNFPNEL